MISIIWVVKFDKITFNIFVSDIDMINAIPSDSCWFPYKLPESICFHINSQLVLLSLPIIKVEVTIDNCRFTVIYKFLKDLGKLQIVTDCCTILCSIHINNIVRFKRQL